MEPFQFKQFSVAQDQCAMKIGTDGVLLGAWARLQHDPQSILDVGTGTGVIALMLAQRSISEVIDAIEIDDLAYEQASTNFENSLWADRLFCYHASFLEFVQEVDDVYDLIVSNPPFYSEDFKTLDVARDKARFEDALPFEHLLAGTAKLLSENGKACFIIPYKEEAHFISIAQQVGLHINDITHIKGNPLTEVKRSLLCFSFTKSAISNKELTIETDRHNYTQEYINITQDFYLKM
jgi:tRNA1Val (adenine37-N6)-methyltransferase